MTGTEDMQQGACRQLEVRVALARLEGTTETSVRRFVRAWLELANPAGDEGLVDVEGALRCCLQRRCSTRSIWRAAEHGISIGALMVDVYRDGFVEGYRDAMGIDPRELAAE